MNPKEQLAQLRQEIDTIDERLVAIFAERMNISKKVAQLKTQNNWAIVDDSRENEVAKKAEKQADETLQGEAALLMRTIMALSRGY
ncbi:MAG: chorismate mutase, partial [Candidatus Adiutrix sp.]